MRIDSHQHFWRYNPEEYGWITEQLKVLRRNFLPGDIKQEMKWCDFEGSIAVQARQSIEETKWLLELADAYPFIKGVVGWADLRSPDLDKQLSMFALNKKLVGVRHIVQDEPDNEFLIRQDFINGIKRVQYYGLAYDIVIYPKQLRAAERLAVQFPDMRFVLDHCAKPFIKNKTRSPWGEDIRELAKCPNVFCKVSGMVTEADWKKWEYNDFIPYLDVVFEAFGTERVMIGSDWPVCTLAGTYQDVLSIVLKYISQYSQEEQDLILGKNAANAYHLS